jgi:outer membrane protein OmpA-like peptidoglycan-associated protein
MDDMRRSSTIDGRIVLFAALFAILGSGYGAASAGSGCPEAQGLFEQSLGARSVESRMSLLERAVALCPSYAQAWNNLGVAYEAQGKFMEAERAYRKALDLAPDFIAPHAGLGDAAMALGRWQEAVLSYERFLECIASARRRGDPQGLGAYETEYRQKLEQARLRKQIHQDSVSGVVLEGTLTRGLRGIKVVGKATKPSGPERLSLCILFRFDSAEIEPLGIAQLREMAAAMRTAELLESRFVVEGHTDTLGTVEYNLDLSRRRSETVRDFLVSSGVSPTRLETLGLGEARPVVNYGSIEEQALNRRVEFVRIGP